MGDLMAQVYKSMQEIQSDKCKELTLTFIDTGLEYPEIREFVPEFAKYLREKYGIKVGLETVKPSMKFPEVIRKYGYPVIAKEVAQTLYSGKKGQRTALLKINGLDKNGNPSKFRKRYLKYKYLLDAHYQVSSKCCDVMKKKPVIMFEKRTGKKPIIATLAEESQLREKMWIQNGCNAFYADRPKSTPISFWTEKDTLRYLKKTGIPYASVYGEIVEQDNQLSFIDDGNESIHTTGCDRTGCVFCMFGIMSDKTPNRFQRMKNTHPKLYEYCIGGGIYDESGMLQPTKNGLGIGKVLDYIGIPY
ncbi:hypothetical protein FACS1894111_06110 [Clostridia bacterium]|nr:hypothetical protein FACS1894111_06110 [Clostridia bacterium]